MYNLTCPEAFPRLPLTLTGYKEYSRPRVAQAQHQPLKFVSVRGMVLPPTITFPDPVVVVADQDAAAMSFTNVRLSDPDAPAYAPVPPVIVPPEKLSVAAVSKSSASG